MLEEFLGQSLPDFPDEDGATIGLDEFDFVLGSAEPGLVAVEGMGNDPVAPALPRDTRVSEGRDTAWIERFCRGLLADERFLTLQVSYRFVLLVGVLEYADVSGRFWPRKRTWAEKSAVGEKTIQRAVAVAESVGLITREGHARPWGYRGSNTYRFDSRLVAAARAEAGLDATDQA